MELVRLAHNRVTRNSGGQRGPAMGSIRNATKPWLSHTCSGQPRVPIPRGMSAGRKARARDTPEGSHGKVSPWGPETPFPTGPCAGRHFPQFLLGFRRGGGASDGFRVWAWRCGRGGGGGGRTGRGRSGATGMDVSGQETDWRSAAFRQKLVSQM